MNSNYNISKAYQKICESYGNNSGINNNDDNPYSSFNHVGSGLSDSELEDWNEGENGMNLDVNDKFTHYFFSGLTNPESSFSEQIIQTIREDNTIRIIFDLTTDGIDASCDCYKYFLSVSDKVQNVQSVSIEDGHVVIALK